MCVGALVREKISPQNRPELLVRDIFPHRIREKTLDYGEGWFIVADTNVRNRVRAPTCSREATIIRFPGVDLVADFSKVGEGLQP
jgi:hypothetical protein